MDELMSYCLSGQDMTEHIDGCAVMNYDDLARGHLLSALRSNRCVALLVPVKSVNNGHWTLIWLQGYQVNFFCPYSKRVDEIIYENPKVDAMPELSLALLNLPARYHFNYNDFKLQQHGASINTCGRHCVIRARYLHLNDREYRDAVLRHPVLEHWNLTPDEFVCMLTPEIRPYHANKK